MKQILRNERGITLVALIITIIVLIILAAVSINVIFNSNFIGLATDGTVNYASAQEEEEKEMYDLYGFMQQVVKKIQDKDFSNDGGSSEGDKPENPTIDIDKSGASEPNLSKLAQKTYVTWKLNDLGTEYVINDAQTTKPDKWYNYEHGEWANIKISQNGLESYWVWIPRYEYIVPTSTTATEIEVKFISKDKIEPDEGYIIHPAFTNSGNGGFGELEGIWVAKFEASSNVEDPSKDYGGGNDKNLKAQIIPNNPSWRAIEVKNIFSVCKKMTGTGEVLEGIDVDSHMMKNTEWGACAILSQSKYGIYNPESINGEKGQKEYQIWNNTSSLYITGSVGSDKNVAGTTTYAYNSIDGPKASTTGTVYGVYDMAGGAWEYVAGVLKGASDDLEYARSKFDISNQGVPNGMTEADFTKKYLDLYNYRTIPYDYSQYIKGDATVETQAWNEDCYWFMDSSRPTFERGRMLF